MPLQMESDKALWAYLLKSLLLHLLSWTDSKHLKVLDKSHGEMDKTKKPHKLSAKVKHTGLSSEYIPIGCLSTSFCVFLTWSEPKDKSLEEKCSLIKCLFI